MDPFLFSIYLSGHFRTLMQYVYTKIVQMETSASSDAQSASFIFRKTNKHRTSVFIATDKSAKQSFQDIIGAFTPHLFRANTWLVDSSVDSGSSTCRYALCEAWKLSILLARIDNSRQSALHESTNIVTCSQGLGLDRTDIVDG